MKCQRANGERFTRRALRRREAVAWVEQRRHVRHHFLLKQAEHRRDVERQSIADQTSHTFTRRSTETLSGSVYVRRQTDSYAASGQTEHTWVGPDAHSSAAHLETSSTSFY